MSRAGDHTVGPLPTAVADTVVTSTAVPGEPQQLPVFLAVYYCGLISLEMNVANITSSGVFSSSLLWVDFVRNERNEHHQQWCF